MIDIIYKPSDLRYIFLKGDPRELNALEAYLNKIPPYMFLPSFSGIPKPEVFLNKFKSKSGDIIYYCHSGLWRNIYNWAAQNNIIVNGIDDKFKYNDFNLSIDQFTEYISKWDLNITPRDYQIKAAWLILKYRQSLSQLATRAGKTLIAYMVFRYMLENGAKKILMIVPSIQLVKQGVEDFKEYKEFFQADTVWAKSEFCESSNLTIGTFQSLVQRADKKHKKYDSNFFKDFDIVCVDEAHHLIAKSINTILSQDFMKGVKLKFGFTGTLPKENTIESFCCQSLMGPKIQDISAKDLIDEGFLAEPYIIQYRINYDPNKLLKDYIECGEYLCGSDKVVNGKKVLLPKEKQKFTIKYEKVLPYALRYVKPLYSSQEYSSYLCDLCKSSGSNLLMLEQMLVHRSQKRLDLMDDIVRNNDKNIIIFAHHTEYINYLYKHFKEKFPDKIVLKITGSTNLKSRQKILKEMEENDNCILVGSFGCISTGITFRNIDLGIFAQSFKSFIINKQSLGRLMLKNKGKKDFMLYDLIDCFPTQRIYKQGIEKIKTYKSEGFKYEIKNI